MSVAWLLALAAGAPSSFVVHVAATADVSSQAALDVADGLENRIQARVGHPGAVSLPEWGACKEDCVDQVRRRTGADTVVLLRLVGGVTRLRVNAERYVPSVTRPTRASVDLDASAPQTWGPGLDALARDLWPAAAPPPAPPVAGAPAPEPPPRARAWAPWVTAAVGVAAVGVGVGFGVSSHDARQTLEGTVLEASARQALADRQRVHGLAANTLFATGGVALLGGLLWAWLDAR